MSLIFFPSLDGTSYVPIGGEASDLGGTRYPMVEKLLLNVAGKVTETQYETRNQYIDGWTFSMKIPEKGNSSIVLTKEMVIDSNTKANISVSFNKEGEIDSTNLPYYRFQIKIQLSYADSAGIINSYSYDFSLNYVPPTRNIFNYSERYNGKQVKRDEPLFKLNEENEETISLNSCEPTICEGAVLFISNYEILLSPLGPNGTQLLGLRIEYNLKDLLTAISALDIGFNSRQYLNRDFVKLCSNVLGGIWGEYFLKSIYTTLYFPQQKRST